MAKRKHSLAFTVSVCLGNGDGGDVCATVDVTDEEFALLKDCCREDEDIAGYDGLEDVYERIIEEARDECEDCMLDVDTDEEIDYDDAEYIIEMPAEIIDAVESEDAE